MRSGSAVDASSAIVRPRPASRRRRWAHRLGTSLLVLGVVGLAYGATIYFWHDPATDLYARWKQHQLSSELDETYAEFRASAGLPAAPASPAPEAVAQSATATADEVGLDVGAVLSEVEELARSFKRQLELGQPFGRIEIPELGIDPIVVHGTRWGADLSRGPGHYPQTSVPGLGEVTAIAGHRTTFGAWFRKIDELEPGDPITLETPYGTFTYTVVGHEIVDDDDWSIIEPRGYDALVLSACHPLYSASQRYIVTARLAEVETAQGVSYAVPGGAGAETPAAPS